MHFKLRYSIRLFPDTYITFEFMAPLPTETRYDSVIIESPVIWEHKNNSLAMKGIRVTLQGPWHRYSNTERRGQLSQTAAFNFSSASLSRCSASFSLPLRLIS